MKLCFTPEAWEDYLHWQGQDRKILKKINQLIEDAKRHPATGIGKPEALKENLKGYWSRRITLEHRLVYTVKDGQLIVVQCRYHY